MCKHAGIPLRLPPCTPLWGLCAVSPSRLVNSRRLEVRCVVAAALFRCPSRIFLVPKILVYVLPDFVTYLLCSTEVYVDGHLSSSFLKKEKSWQNLHNTK